MASFRAFSLSALCLGAAAALSFYPCRAQAQIAGRAQLMEQKRAEALARAAARPGGRSSAEPNAALFGGAPFPAAGGADGAEKQGAFSYLLEGGFVRISFARAEGKDKTLYGLAELDLKPGWKTYWRNPGSSGLAPRAELSGGARAELLFPAPQLLQSEDGWNYGYQDHVIFPFRISLPTGANAAKQSFYAGGLSLGICSAVCMPQKLAFRFSSAAIKTNKEQQALLRQTLAALPKAADKNFGLISAKTAQSGESQALELRLAAPGGTGAQLYLDGGEALQLGLAKLIRTEAACPPAVKHSAKQAKGRAQLKNDCPLIFTYQAPLLFGAAQKGAPIHYTAVAGEIAVSGVVAAQ